MARIESIVYKPRQTSERPVAYLREPLEQAKLVAGYGIEGDRKGGHRKRQLNILSHETVLALRADGFRTEPGELGEQIVVSGLDVATLAPGERFQLGDSAVVEVVGQREPCERFELAQDKPMSTAVGRIGIIARVVSDGEIRVGDPVTLAGVTAYPRQQLP